MVPDFFRCLVMGCACLLVIAGTIEGFLSPSNLPPGIKIATGIGTGVAMYSYLLLAGRPNSTFGKTEPLNSN